MWPALLPKMKPARPTDHSGATAEEDEITKYDESGFTLPKQKNGSIPSFACFCLIVATLQTLMGFLLVPPDLSLTHFDAWRSQIS